MYLNIVFILYKAVNILLLQMTCAAVQFMNLLIYIQQDKTLSSLFFLETALNVSGVTTTHHHQRIQLYLQHLVFVTPLLLPAAIVEKLELLCRSNSCLRS
jgi:hypothetical protein